MTHFKTDTNAILHEQNNLNICANESCKNHVLTFDSVETNLASNKIYLTKRCDNCGYRLTVDHIFSDRASSMKPADHIGRKVIIESHIDDALVIVKQKLMQRLESKGDGSYTSIHEILGIITEEFHELVDAVKSDETFQVKDECLDLGVAAVFAIACINAGGLHW